VGRHLDPVRRGGEASNGMSPNVFFSSGEDGSVKGAYAGGSNPACGNIGTIYSCNPCTQTCIDAWSPNCYNAGCIVDIKGNADWSTCEVHCVAPY
jgi:hypothetical protein